MTMILLMTSALTSALAASVTPFPNQLFSLILKAKDPPSVPTPAPALISPVGISSTTILIFLEFGVDPSVILSFTDPNILLLLI